jgi:hypothetical protein
MRFATLLLFVLVASLAAAQVTVTGTVPGNGTTGVSTNALLSFTFNAPMDTIASLNPKNDFISNVDSVTAVYWSTNRLTCYFQAILQPNTAYFVVLYHATVAGGGTLQTPYHVDFTTAATYAAYPYTVSGTILSGSSGFSSANALIALSTTPFSGNSPTLVSGGVADGSGNFTVEHVAPGTYYPLAVKDADGNGEINPGSGDPIAIGDPVVVTTSNVSGLNLVFQSTSPMTWSEARDSALAYAAAHLPVNRELRRASAWAVDSLARASDWEFIYTQPGSSTVTQLRVNPFGVNAESRTDWSWIFPARPMANILQAALADSVVARTERQGGAAFRAALPTGQSLSNIVRLEIGDLRYAGFWDMVPDTTKVNWGVTYLHGREVNNDSTYILTQKRFILDYVTGEILGVAAVKDQPDLGTPAAYALAQNYPNPFNPSTRIEFELPAGARVHLAVFDVLGRQVAVLENREFPAGRYQSTWNGMGANGNAAGSGVYICRLSVSGQGNDRLFTRKMLLMK